MKCQKCGANMVSGHLYCDICGAEYQIVPDFEPEIENSIAESLSDISDTLSKKKTKNAATLKKQKVSVPSFFVILFCVFLSSIILLFVYEKHKNSTEYLNKQALNAIQKQDFYQASLIYEELRNKDPDNAYWYVNESKIYQEMGDLEQACHLAKTAVTLKENTELAYEHLISLLIEMESYSELVTYLDKCNYESIKEKYSNYLSLIPKINYESGNYEHSLDISFGNHFKGNIYYTLDGTVPTKASKQYHTSIKLGNGSHILTVVYENEVFHLSEPETYYYEIQSEIPLAPVINLSSGKYSMASMLEIDMEEGTRVFYTNDLSKPTMESTEYTGPIPMPLGESRFNFIAYSQSGIASDITQRNYMLNIKTNLSLEQAEVKLIEKLISIQHILDKNGAVLDRYGVFRYFFKYVISEAEMNYYVFEEHYMENQINNPLQHFYAVDVLYGTVYKLISDGNGNYTRVEF